MFDGVSKLYIEFLNLDVRPKSKVELFVLVQWSLLWDYLYHKIWILTFLLLCLIDYDRFDPMECPFTNNNNSSTTIISSAAVK